MDSFCIVSTLWVDANSKSVFGCPFSFTEPFVKVTMNAAITMAIIVGKVTLGFKYQGAFSPL